MTQTKQEKLELLAKHEFSELEFYSPENELNTYVDSSINSLDYILRHDIRVKPKEMFVNVFKDKTVDIHRSLDEAVLNSIKSALQYRFKAVECDYETYVKCKEWTACVSEDGYCVIFKGSQLLFSIANCFAFMFSKDTKKKVTVEGKTYILELLYEAKEEPPEPPSEVMEKVLPSERIELLPKMKPDDFYNITDLAGVVANIRERINILIQRENERAGK